MKIQYDNLIGDILITSAIIIYHGPFTSKYRKQLLVRWSEYLKQQSIPRTEEFEIEKVLKCSSIARNWLS